MKLSARTVKRDSDKVEMERCVLCSCKTAVPKNRPVTERKYYIQGAGQLCEECYYRVYGSNCGST